MGRMKYLGQQVQKAVKKLDLIPWVSKGEMVVTLKCSEFTSHCPVTKQPDFATLEIEYRPLNYLVETKSIKLFLWQFRNRAQFNERLIEEIGDKFFDQVKPKCMEIRGSFYARGGISVCPTYYRAME